MSRIASRLLFAAAALAAAPVIVLAIAAASTPHRTDLKCFWTSSHFLARGLDPYDGAVWSPAVAGLYENMLGRLGQHSCGVPDNYPLTSAVITLPLGWLPLELAAYLWALVGLAGLTLGIAFLARGGGIGRAGAFALALVLFASPHAWWNSIFLQHGGLLVAGLGLLALPSASRSAARTSVGVLLLAIKPHVAPLAVLDHLRAATPQARAATVAALGAVIAVSLTMLPSWPLDWLSSLGAQRSVTVAASSAPWALVRALTGSEAVALLVSVGGLALFVIALRGVPLRDVVDRMAVAVTAWLLVLPYISGQDFLVLAVVWCALIRRGWVVPAFIVADLIPWTAMRVNSELGLAVVAPITAAVLVIALRVVRPDPSPHPASFARAG